MIAITIVFTIIWINGVKDGYVDFGSHYARLGDGYNSRLFSPCISKRCRGGPYMYSDNPYMQAVCQACRSGACVAECGKGFKLGPPVKFEYSSLSDGTWDNVLCNKSSGCCGAPQKSTSLCVL